MDSQQQSQIQSLLDSLTVSPHQILQASEELHKSVTALAKYHLDSVAYKIAEEQAQRLKDARKKRKRGEVDHVPRQVLGIKKIHVDGFKTEQIWEQARRVLDATVEETGRGLSTIAKPPEAYEASKIAANRFTMDDEDEEQSVTEVEDPVENDSGMESYELEDNESSNDEAENTEENPDEKIVDGSEGSDYEEEYNEPVTKLVEDKFGLNDGFFSIDDFNRQSDFLEQQDLRGDDDGAASDEEDIDWDANPLEVTGPGLDTSGTTRRRNDHYKEYEDDEDDEDEDDGPTFGDMDLNAPEGASDVEFDDDDEELDTDGPLNLTNANEIMYNDFFAPPARKSTGKNKKKRGRPNPHNFPDTTPSAPGDTSPTDAERDDVQRTISAVHRDLFSDSSDDQSDDDLSEVDPGDPKARRSAHERRQAKIFEEIRRLEAENVAKRAWTLSGEARAADRPLNSLLEEDLDFERAGKPVPVITQEVSEDIEALIKRRILAQDFDELIRRRPDDLATGPRTRRGLIELSDTKSSKGLAEMYEDEYRAQTDPNYVAEKDSKLAAAHTEISTLWKNVSASLDALSSWHYKPKPAAPALDIRVDTPVIMMEDARPSAGGDVASASQLAPQEVYAPGQEKRNGTGEVTTKGGLPVSMEEMSREEKVRRRRRNKERQKKASFNAVPVIKRNPGTNGAVNGANNASRAQRTGDREEIVGALKKGGVQVIGKKGELTNVDGKTVKEDAKGRKVGVGAYKL
jgi:U3 small nucleolar RNA-associated protein MPP10